MKIKNTEMEHNTDKKEWHTIAIDMKSITKEEDPYLFFSNQKGSCIRVRKWKIEGSATHKNFVQKTKKRKNKLGLRAWTEVFAKFALRDGVLTFYL